MQFTLRINTMIHDVNSAFSPDQSVLSFRSTATRSQCLRRHPASPGMRIVSKGVYETSHNHRRRSFHGDSSSMTASVGRSVGRWYKLTRGKSQNAAFSPLLCRSARVGTALGKCTVTFSAAAETDFLAIVRCLVFTPTFAVGYFTICPLKVFSADDYLH